jgi:L-alanine-DL-glutamate epimerase-like enolase superfamily enzyme
MSLWDRFAALPLVVESYALEPLEDGPIPDRATTHIRLLGAGADGLGEDIGPFGEERDALLAAGPTLPLAGEWTLASFSAHLATLDQWPAPPSWEAARRFRNWAYESAALDLALRQAGRTLPDVVEREPRPVRFVNSLGLGDPPSTDVIHRRVERYPSVRFKLDAAPDWSAEQIADLAALGAVEIVDFKGRYELPVEDEAALVTLFEGVLAAFGDALFEDPHDRPEIAPLVRPHAARVSYDAPIVTAADVGATATVNIKPSRVGTLRALLDLYEHCEARGVRTYGGGMGEIGVGRGQVQLLASLFHPDAPNDVAPAPFNAPDPPPGLPTSPLPAPRGTTGFRWEA